jgi:hypothetical protein
MEADGWVGRWTYTNNGGVNNTIALTNGNQCLDRKDGTGLFLQTYEVRFLLLRFS